MWIRIGRTLLNIILTVLMIAVAIPIIVSGLVFFVWILVFCALMVCGEAVEENMNEDEEQNKS